MPPLILLIITFFISLLSLSHYFLYLIVHLWNKSLPQDHLYIASLLPIQRVNSLS
jgi:hypothetical protein